MREVAEVYGKRGFASYPSISSIEQFLTRGGPGARGIVYGGRGPGELAHFFNAVNQGGDVVFIDATTGGLANTQGYSFFQMMRTE
jgi:hypothetical protein